MPTINQLVRKPRKPVTKKTKAPALRFVHNSLTNRTTAGRGIAPEARRLYGGPHRHSQEAELCPAQGLPRTADQRH